MIYEDTHAYEKLHTHMKRAATAIAYGGPKTMATPDDATVMFGLLRNIQITERSFRIMEALSVLCDEDDEVGKKIWEAVKDYV